MIHVLLPEIDRASFFFAVEKYIIDNMDGNQEYFFMWKTKPTVMIGKHQNTYAEINPAFIKEKGIEVVRRLSGGGTIYTDEGCFLYTFIVNGHKEVNFTKYMNRIVNAVSKCGIKAELNGRNDILCNGKKFSGNAQFKKGKKTTHHGSILFDTNISDLVRTLNVNANDEKILSKGIKSVKDRVINLKESVDMTMDEFKDVVTNYVLGDDNQTFEFDQETLKELEKIEQEIFRNWDFTYGVSKQFEIEKVRRIEGCGTFTINLTLKKGIIDNVALYGDFFTEKDYKTIIKGLIGLKFTQEDISSYLSNVDISDYIVKLSNQELVDLILE